MELLDKACSPLNKSEAIIHYFGQDCDDELFDYFFGAEFLSVNYKKTLQILLKFKLSNKKKILTYSALATIALLQLNMQDLEEYISLLRAIPESDYRPFAINPLHCFEAMQQLFEHGIVERDFFRDITKFYFNPPLKNEGPNDESSEDLIYLIIGYCLTVCRKPRKTLRYVAAMERTYKTYAQPTNVNRFFLEVLKVDSYYALGAVDKVLAHYTIIEDTYKQDPDCFTPYMITTLYNARIKIMVLKGDYSQISEYLDKINEICSKTGVRLSQVFILIYLLHNPKLQNTEPELYKKVQQNYQKTLRESGINIEAFFNPAQIK